MATTKTTIRTTVDALASARAMAEAANASVKRLEAKLKGYGDGVYEGTEHTVLVGTFDRKKTAWKALAESLATEAQVELATTVAPVTTLRITGKKKEAA